MNKRGGLDGWRPKVLKWFWLGLGFRGFGFQGAAVVLIVPQQ